MVGVIDLGQRRHRQQPIGDDAGQDNGQHAQGGGYRAKDEQPREIHAPPFFALSVVAGVAALTADLPCRCSVGVVGTSWLSLTTSTSLPSFRRSVPSNTTRSPADRPSVTTVFHAVTGADFQLTDLDLLVTVHGIGERAVGAELDRGRRRQHYVFEGVGQQAYIDELVGEQRLIAVLETGLEFQGAGGDVDLVVQALQYASGLQFGIATIQASADSLAPLR